ncbi:IclR family transcriptional regulator [Maritalea myrionectae]|uniref:IclR family transcriptional regulator n=1 Tax=Maritalea myrionectae TaxID=454601 RepID=UPI000424FFA1|nr:IclR family transcriptional regulator [Maritalea myrionectae]
MADKKQSKSPVQSLDRAFGLLNIIADAPEGIALGALAQQADLAPSTTHRLLGALEGQGMVAFDAQAGAWQIGLGAFQIGAAFLHRREFVAAARAPMRRLMQESGETVNLAILNRGTVVFVAQIECDEVMRMAVKIGSVGPLHASAVGKAMLAFGAAEEVDNLTANLHFPRLTDKTILDLPAFENELETVKNQGFAVDDEEQSLGLRCIAAPVFNEFAEPVCALSISGPTVRVTQERTAELAEMVINAAHRVTTKLGGKFPH